MIYLRGNAIIARLAPRFTTHFTSLARSRLGFFISYFYICARAHKHDTVRSHAASRMVIAESAYSHDHRQHHTAFRLGPPLIAYSPQQASARTHISCHRTFQYVFLDIKLQNCFSANPIRASPIAPTIFDRHRASLGVVGLILFAGLFDRFFILRALYLRNKRSRTQISFTCTRRGTLLS